MLLEPLSLVWGEVHPRVCGEADNTNRSRESLKSPSPPRSASIRKLRSAGARQRIELRRRHRTERVSLARRLGRAAVRALRVNGYRDPRLMTGWSSDPVSGDRQHDIPAR